VSSSVVTRFIGKDILECF